MRDVGYEIPADALQAFEFGDVVEGGDGAGSAGGVLCGQGSGLHFEDAPIGVQQGHTLARRRAGGDHA